MTVAFLVIEHSFSSAMLLAEPFRECNEHELHAICSWRIPGQAQDIKVEVQKQIINLQFFFSVNFFFNNQTSYCSTAQLFVFRKRNVEEMTSEEKIFNF